MITDSIQEARKKGMTDDAIVQEIMKQNPQKSDSFNEAINKGMKSSEILDEIVRQNQGNVVQPIAVKPTFGSFLKKEITGGTTEAEMPQGGVGGFAAGLLQETVGSKGLLGVAQMPGKVIKSAILIQDKQRLSTTISTLANLTAQQVIQMRGLPEGERKDRLNQIVKDNFEDLKKLNQIAVEQEQGIMETREALATTGRAIATVVGGGGKTLAQQSLRAGLAGAGYGVASGVEEEATPAELLKRGAIGFATAALIPGAMKVGNAIVQKVVVKPLKGVANTVSRFFFGPEGTTGFGVRFEDPTLSGFLKTAQRRPGGAKLEDITTMLHGAVKAVKDKMKSQFAEAEEELVEKPIVRKTVTETVKKNIIDFLRIDKATAKEVASSGMDDTQVRAVNRILREVEKLPKNPTTKDVLRMRRIVDTFYRGTKNTKQSDAIVSKTTNYLNSLIKAVDKDFAKASERYAVDSKFLSLLQKNVIGTTKESVEQTANNLFTIAKNLDNPFKREASQKLLQELSDRSGVDFLKILKGLAAAENLSPQQSLGLRAGIVRELVRMMQGQISNLIGVAGVVRQKIPKVPQNILEELGKGAGMAGRIGAIKTVEDLFNK